MIGRSFAAFVLLWPISTCSAQVCPVQAAKLTMQAGVANDNLGTSLSVLGDELLAGAPRANGTGAALHFAFDALTWVQDGLPQPAENTVGDYLGSACSLGPGLAVIGAAAAGPNNSTYYGAAYVFARDEHGWAQQAALNPPFPSNFDGFAYAVATDGQRVVVSNALDTPAVPGTGALYVYEFQGGVWSTASALYYDQAYTSAGAALALQGDILISGAPTDHVDGGRYPGAAYVYRRDPITNQWYYDTKLNDAVTLSVNLLGWSVGISGNRVIAGAPDDSQLGFIAGAAYIFEQQFDGSWSQVRLVPSGYVGSTFELSFGYSCAIDGDLAVVGAVGETNYAGAAYIFQRQPDGTWPQVARLAASDRASDSWFGYSVSISGTRVAIGAPHADVMSDKDGAVYIFELACSTGCTGDLNNDGAVNLADLATQLAHYGEIGAPPEHGDLNGDGIIDLTDLAGLLAVYGSICP